MEKIEQQEKLPITEQQIKDFLWWCRKFSGKWKKIDIWPGKTETTFKSYEENGKKYINAKNDLMDATREYNPVKGIISAEYNNSDTLWRVLAKDWPLDRKGLEHDLNYFQNCFPSIGKKIFMILGSKKKKSWS